jgi:hypothetical protein
VRVRFCRFRFAYDLALNDPGHLTVLPEVMAVMAVAAEVPLGEVLDCWKTNAVCDRLNICGRGGGVQVPTLRGPVGVLTGCRYTLPVMEVHRPKRARQQARPRQPVARSSNRDEHGKEYVRLGRGLRYHEKVVNSRHDGRRPEQQRPDDGRRQGLPGVEAA